MKIVVLDGYTLNPGDLDWGPVKALGDTVIHDRTEHEEPEILNRLQGVEIALTNKTPLSGSVIGQLPALRYIGVLATGFNVVDIEAAASRSIPVANIPIYGTDSVAQMTFAHILDFCHKVSMHSKDVKAGGWTRSQDFCYWNTHLMELAGKTMGIIGFGRIGRRVGEVANAFGMRVLAQDIYKGETPKWPGFTWCEVDDLLAGSDFVSLHCPLTPDNNGLMNAKRLSMMKPTAFFLNLSRGPLVVDADLAQALENNVIAGAGIDVMEQEPPAADNPLLKAPNLNITPHIAWATREARSRLLNTAAENIEAFLKGNPTNLVNNP